MAYRNGRSGESYSRGGRSYGEDWGNQGWNTYPQPNERGHNSFARQSRGTHNRNPVSRSQNYSVYVGKGNQQPSSQNFSTPKNPAAATASQSSGGGTLKRKATLPVIEIPLVDQCAANITLKILTTAWTKNRENDFTLLLHKALDESRNPYSLGLYLATRSSDFLSIKDKSVSLSVISEFNAWLLKSDLETLATKHLTRELQVIAFDSFTVQKNSKLLKMAFIIFRLDTMKDKLIVRIKQMCADKRYKEACVGASTLDLHSHFTIHDFVLPLIFQSRETIAEEFLSGSKDKQNELLRFLDELIAKRDLGNVIQDYISTHKIPEAKMEKLYNKPLQKLLKRLSSKFQADPETCPNAARRQRFGALHHLMVRKYSEEVDMSEESFLEMVEQTVGEDSELRSEAIYKMRMHGDKATAAKIAIRLAIPLNKIPDDVLEIMPHLNPNIVPNPAFKVNTSFVEEDWDDVGPPSKRVSGVDNSSKSTFTSGTSTVTTVENDDVQIIFPYDVIPQTIKKGYYTPGFKYEIKNLTSSSDMLAFIHILEEEVKKVAPDNNIVTGFDAEWKPMFRTSSGAALLQIALKETVYLIDVIQLKAHGEKATQSKEEPSMSDIWTVLKDTFFANKFIMKVSYDIKNDLKMIGETVPEWRNIKMEFKSCVDLCVLEKDILRKDCSFFPHFDEPSTDTGLSELVRLCLGHPLNKEDQFSNWEQRPLRASQINYAAKDVYCLLEVFQFLVNSEGSMSGKITNYIEAQLNPETSKTGSERIQKKPSAIMYAKKALTMGKPPDATDSNLPFEKQGAADIKFVCDNMLQGLGKKLRACGLDTMIIAGSESHDLGAHYATTDNRYLLTKGATYDQIVNCIPPNQAYKVTSEAVVEQLREIICHFNLAILSIDLFSRCQKCNTVCFIQVPGKIMKKLLLDLSVNINRKFTDQERILSENATSQEGIITFSTPGQERSAKRWKLLPINSIYISEGRLKTSANTIVEITKIPLQFLESIDNFYVCDFCGKCYWESFELEKQLFESHPML